MRRILACTVLALVALVGSAVAQSPPMGEWTVVPAALGAPRAGATSVLLADGLVLIAGGDGAAGPLASAELYWLDGTFSTTASMGIARSRHAMVGLADGRVLVAGGQTPDGVTTSAEVYDSTIGAWSPVGDLGTARAGHTATVLADGRVLIAGGTNESALTLELFDPQTDTFASAGSSALGRTGHAAALLADDRVLLVGGVQAGAPTSVADLYDPKTGAVTPTDDLEIARAGLSATTLVSGGVLIAGGVGGLDGMTNLGSVEVFDPETATFSLLGDILATPRSDHSAFLLPHNNSVLIVGGRSAGVALGSAELFIDHTAHHGPTEGMVRDTPPLWASREELTGSPVTDGVLLVAGGRNEDGIHPSAEVYYSFPTVKTDRDDYAPGETVTITGSGWKAGEVVTLELHEDLDPPFHDDVALYATADAEGNIVNTEYAPEEHDIGVTYDLIALGLAENDVAWQARARFTDGGTLTVNFLGTGGGLISSTTGTPSACSGTCSIAVANNGNFDVTATPAIGSSFVSWTGCDSLSSSGALTNNVCRTRLAPDPTDRTISVTFNISKANQTISFGALGGKTFGDAPFVVSATASSGLPVSFASLTTGVCTLASTTVTIVAAGTCTIRASQAGNANYNAAPNVDQSFTVAKADQTILFGALGGKTYGDAPFVIAATGGSGNPVTFSTTTPAVCSSSGTNGSTITILAAGACTVRASQLGNANYNAASDVDQGFTIAQKPASVTLDAAGKEYGGVDPGLTGTLAGFLASDGVTAAYSRVAGETVGAYLISAVLSPAGVLGNYDITYNTADFTIAQKPASVTPDAAGKEYGGVDPGLTGTLAGFLASDGVTAAYSRVAGETVGAYLISAVLSPAGVLGNYDITYNTADFTIGKKTLTVSGITANNKPYDGNLTATLNVAGATLVGVVMGDVVTLNTAGATGTFATPSVGTGKTVNIAGLIILGADAGNYSLTQPTGITANITGWHVTGYHQPVGIANTYPGTSSATAPWNTIKGGQAVPLKFNLYTMAGGTELTSISDVTSLSLVPLACTGGAEAPVTGETFTTTGSQLSYDGSQFHANWKTPKGANSCWRVTMQASDGTTISANFKTK